MSEEKDAVWFMCLIGLGVFFWGVWTVGLLLEKAIAFAWS